MSKRLTIVLGTLLVVQPKGKNVKLLTKEVFAKFE